MRFGPFYLSFLGAVLCWGVFLITLAEGYMSAWSIPAGLCSFLCIYWGLAPSISDIVEMETAHWKSYGEVREREVKRRFRRIDKMIIDLEKEKQMGDIEEVGMVGKKFYRVKEVLE